LARSAKLLLAVAIPETPGSFLRFCECLGKRSVTEFNYRSANTDTAHLFVGLALKGGKAERDASSRRSERAAYGGHMTDNEMAKLHVRHMVGGSSPGLSTSTCTASNFPNGRAPC